MAVVPPTGPKRAVRRRPIKRQAATQEGIRCFLVYLTASMTCFFVSGAALYGLWHGTFDALAGVWTVAGPIVGGLLSYYFNGKREMA